MFDLITGAINQGPGGAGFTAAILGMGMGIFLLVFLPLYIYSAVTLMIIAKRTKTDDAWMAWIPFLNIYLMAKVGRVPLWSLALFALMFLPVVGSLAISGMMVWYWWMIAERMNRPGWWGVLMLVPVLNLVLMGILAWGDMPKAANVSKASKSKKKSKK